MLQHWLGAFVALSMGAGAGVAGDGITGPRAFDRLKELAGSWEGHVATPDGPEARVEYRITSGGNTVMEVLFPGTAHEMVSLYYLDGEDLVAKHYCSMGNQPEMKLDRNASSENELHFAFTGGTNFDPAKDTHIHGGTIRFEKDGLTSDWAVFTNGKEETSNRFFLTRTAER